MTYYKFKLDDKKSTNEITGIGENDAQKRLWKVHQQNEYTHINHYKEGLCFGCFGKDTAFAMVVDCCEDCHSKLGVEAKLTDILYKFNAYCYFCKKYKFHVRNINIRLCHKCHVKVAEGLHDYNKAGGHFEVNPFYKRMRKKWGKDFQILLSDGLQKQFPV